MTTYPRGHFLRSDTQRVHRIRRDSGKKTKSSLWRAPTWNEVDGNSIKIQSWSWSWMEMVRNTPACCFITDTIYNIEHNTSCWPLYHRLWTVKRFLCPQFSLPFQVVWLLFFVFFTGCGKEERENSVVLSLQISALLDSRQCKGTNSMSHCPIKTYDCRAFGTFLMRRKKGLPKKLSAEHKEVLFGKLWVRFYISEHLWRFSHQFSFGCQARSLFLVACVTTCCTEEEYGRGKALSNDTKLLQANKACSDERYGWQHNGTISAFCMSRVRQIFIDFCLPTWFRE